MARLPRRDTIDESNVGVYHCINRCVRRAYLCGVDPVSGKNHDHRKTWIQQRLEFLAGIFAIDVIGFSVLSNHFHLILRNRPNVVDRWPDSEVAQRWWNLFPARRNDDGTPATPRKSELKALAKKRHQLRKRLSSISWMMRCLAENVARRANVEEDISGRFFQGRFKSQKLLDESSILACAMYVDPKPQRRASDRGFLSLTLDQYLELLDWTGRQVRADKRGAIPAQFAPILERLQVSTNCWVDLVTGFGRWFRRTVGRPSNMAEESERLGCHWLHGISHAREAFT